MKIEIYNSIHDLGVAAGMAAATIIREAVKTKDGACIILATGTSQFETLEQLVREDIAWDKVTMFHLDEYIGLPESHPASFRKYLKERFLTKVPALSAAYLIDGEADPFEECKRLGNLIGKQPVDLALVGIGENGHLAFNDPPADFNTNDPYIIVSLDDACRKQQVGEGWFRSEEEVPKKAISMSIKQILKSQFIICSVAGSRKAVAVKNALEHPVSNMCPATALQQHHYCTCFLDTASAALLANHANGD